VGTKSKIGCRNACRRHNATQIGGHGKGWYAIRGRCLALLQNVQGVFDDQERDQGKAVLYAIDG
jgi:hypothetical protein